MKRGFSNEVKQALNDIYYNVGTRKGAEGFALLEQASAAGDGDASCILARCLCGKQYVWPQIRRTRQRTGCACLYAHR